MIYVYDEFRNKEYPELRTLIFKKFGSQKRFAEELGITSVSLNKKLNGHVPFKKDEIDKMIDIFNFSPDDIVDIFFAS